MNRKELELFISKLEGSENFEEAYFGIFQYGGASEESFLKVNKEGLEVLAIQLLKARLDFENNEKETIGFEKDLMDDMSNTYIDYIECISKTKSEIEFDSDSFVYKSTLRDKFFELGCLGLIIIGALIFISGVSTIIKWLF